METEMVIFIKNRVFDYDYDNDHLLTQDHLS